MLKALGQATVVSLLVGALFTPPLYSLFMSRMDEVPWPYSRVFDRVALLALLICLIVWRRRFEVGRIKAAFRAEPRGWTVRVALGVALSFLAALAILPLLVRSPTLQWSSATPSRLAVDFLRELAPALLVSVAEESFFRVLVFDSFKRRLPLVPAVFAASLFYAFVHFISPDKKFQYEGWTWSVGFEYLGNVFAKFASPGVLLGMLGLTLVGAVLCMAIHRSRSIALCIGLHAGWFLIAKIAVFSISVAPGESLPAGLNKRYFLLAQPWTWLSVLVVGGLLALWMSRARAEDDGEPSTAD